MAWIVTAWKPEVLVAAEREARRRMRAADREVTDAVAYLAVIEELGADMRERVRSQRRELPLPLMIPERRTAPAPPAPGAGRMHARTRRATLHESPLGELFRATGQGFTGPAGRR